MHYLRGYRIDSAKRTPAYPFSVETLRTETARTFARPVTFFAGENGSGKSTLLEGIARAVGMPALGAQDTANDPTLQGIAPLSDALRLVWTRRPKRSFFLRSEDFFGFIQRVMAMQQDLSQDLSDIGTRYEGRSDYARGQASMPYQGSLQSLESQYGINPDAQSHGESFLSIFQSRMLPGGLYLLDEPESALSPTRQMALLVLLHTLQDSCQFIIATHSPILLALPGAEILSFDDGIQPMAWDDLPQVQTMRRFLEAPKRYLRHLLDDA